MEIRIRFATGGTGVRIWGTMSDDAPPPSPGRRGIPTRFVVIAIIVITLIAAYFIPLRACTTCLGTGKRPDVHSSAPPTLPCYQCEGKGRQTFLEIAWPVWGS